MQKETRICSKRRAKKTKTETNAMGLTTERLVLIKNDPRSTIKISSNEKTASRPLLLIQVALMWLAEVKFNREYFILVQRNKWKDTNIWVSINMADWEKMDQEPAGAELDAFAFAIEMLDECCDHTTEVMMTQCTTRHRWGNAFICCFLGYLNETCMVTNNDAWNDVCSSHSVFFNKVC